MITKFCPKCKKEKDIHKFAGNKASKDGLYYRCKSCVNKYNKQHNTLESTKESKAQYRENNYEELSNKEKLRYQENRVKILERQKRKHKRKKKKLKQAPNYEQLSLRAYVTFVLKPKVLKRDNYTCVLCNVMFMWRELQVHHIIPVNIDPTKITDLDNLTTLCFNCHLDKAHNGHYKDLNLEIMQQLQWRTLSYAKTF